MNEYQVELAIDVDADTPEEAVLNARALLYGAATLTYEVMLFDDDDAATMIVYVDNSTVDGRIIDAT